MSKLDDIIYNFNTHKREPVVKAVVNDSANDLRKWTVVHETDGNDFSVDELDKALHYQKHNAGKVTCSQTCCRLKVFTSGKCILHSDEKDRKRYKIK